MILTPLSASIEQHAEGDTLSGASLGMLLFGRNGSGIARYVGVNDNHQLQTDIAVPVALTNEGGFPAIVAVTSGGSGVTVLAANASRKPGSYIQNISDTEIEYNYGTTITSGQAGLLSPGGVLKLYEGANIYQGAIRMYQNSGSSKNIWIASFV